MQPCRKDTIDPCQFDISPLSAQTGQRPDPHFPVETFTPVTPWLRKMALGPVCLHPKILSDNLLHAELAEPIPPMDVYAHDPHYPD